MSPLFIFALALALCPSGIVADEVDTHPNSDLTKHVDQLFSRWDNPSSPGCAVGIVQDGKLVYSKGIGSADLEHEVPNTPTTIFEIMSASKAFTSACIALLMDQGRIHPDDLVRKFVPEMHEFETPIRIRHMLRCESGIWAQVHIMPLAGWDNLPWQNTYLKDDVLAVLSGQKTLPFVPGTDFQYGSGDFFLLGIVVERVTGKTLAQFAEENLFQPLGMNRTYYEEDAGLVVKHRAIGHYKDKFKWSVLSPSSEGQWRLWQPQGYFVGGGGVHTCVEDLFRWNQAFEVDNHVLPRGKYLNEFLTQGTVLGNRFVVDGDAYVKRVETDAENAPPGEYRGLKRIQFTGGAWGMTFCFARFPDENLAVFCLSNNDELSPFAKTREIADLLLADKLQPIDTVTLDEEVVELSTHELKKLIGAFRAESSSPIWRTEIDEGNLTLINHLDQRIELKPVSTTRFKPVGEHQFYPSARLDFSYTDQDTLCMTLSSHERGFHDVTPFRAVQLVDPVPEKLRSYAGTYLSDELGSIYRFKVDDNALWLRLGSRRWERLRATVQDEFTPDRRHPHDQRFVKFHRDARGDVIGMTIAFWRVHGVRFEKNR